MDCGQPHVACRHTVFPSILQMREEREDMRYIQVGEIQRRDRRLALLRDITQQQGDAVAITMNGMRARSAQPGQMIGEVVADNRAEQICCPSSSIQAERSGIRIAWRTARWRRHESAR